MAIPYHTHNYEMPTATKEDILAGVSNDKVVVPASLGTAATKNSDEFATSEQGEKADNAARSDIKITVGDGLSGGGTLSNDINVELSETTLSSLQKANNALPNSTLIATGEGLIGGGAISNGLTISLSPSTISKIDQIDNSIKNTVQVKAGQGLTGGGQLSSDITLSLSSETQEALNKVYGAVQSSRKVNTKDGITGGGQLSNDLTIGLSSETIASINKADTAVQPSSLKSLAYKDKIEVADISSKTTPTASTFLSGDGTWKAPNGSGDMLSTIYDPKNKKADAFNMGNMVENSECNNNTGALILTNTERQTIKDNAEFIKAIKDHVLDAMVSGAIEMLPLQALGYRMMLANGSLYKRADFPVLWAAIKNDSSLVTETQWNNGFQGAFSIGDGSTTFRVPNYLGYFPRFLDKSGSIDPNRTVGSVQGDAIRNLSGSVTIHSGETGSGFWSPTGVFSKSPVINNYRPPNNATSGANSINSFSFNASAQVPTANENRPINIALLPIIRF